MTRKVIESTAFEAEFERFLAEEAEAPAWLTAFRQAGMKGFRELGLPGPQDEDWLYTNAAPLRKNSFPSAPATAIVPKSLAAHRFALGIDDGPKLVFLNGRYQASLSSSEGLPENVVLESLAQAFAEGNEALRRQVGRRADARVHAFAALNEAFLRDGAFLHLPRGCEVAAPIQLIFLHTPTGGPVAVHPRIVVLAEENSRATIVERYGIDCIGALAGGACLTNAVSEYELKEGAAVKVVRLQREGAHTYHVGLTAVLQMRSSRFESTAVSLGGAIDRNETRLLLAEADAECTLNGLYVISNEEHVDNHLVVRHAAPNCRSGQLYKGILGGKSRGAFTGKVVVDPGAQGTAAEQANHNLLLSRAATAETRPQLEIYADDVRCAHGATIGRLDDEALYYLRARGIGPIRARNLLVHAFAGEITEAVGDERLTEGLEMLLAARLEAGPASASA